MAPACVAMVVIVVSCGFAVAQNDRTVNVTGNDNVVSVGQIGGITAKTVTVIEQALRPEFRILERNDEDLPDGTHAVTVLGDIQSPITPGLLLITIESKGLRDVRIMPPAAGGISTMMMRNVRRGHDYYSTEIPAPRGQYNIRIVTAKDSDIKFAVGF